MKSAMEWCMRYYAAQKSIAYNYSYRCGASEGKLDERIKLTIAAYSSNEATGAARLLLGVTTIFQSKLSNASTCNDTRTACTAVCCMLAPYDKNSSLYIVLSLHYNQVTKEGASNFVRKVHIIYLFTRRASAAQTRYSEDVGTPATFA